METVNNLTSAASRAIWGTPNKDIDATQNGAASEEPRSGETGDVSAGEPYDKGNAEPTSTPSNTESTDPTSTTDTASSLPSTSTSSTKTDMPGNTTTTMPIRSEHETEKTGVTSAHNPTSAISSDPPSSSNDTSGAGPTPSVGADPSSAAQETEKQQGADKPMDAPAEGSDEHKRIAETKKEAEEAAKVDTSGPGPKPLSEIKKDGGAATGATGADEEDGPQKESHGEGTGEKYVKSSGLKADGGDFDAANPGAAKEADRLLEQKGIRREAPGKSEPVEESSKTDTKDSNESGGKLSGLKEKIKAKLHKS